MIGEEAFNQLQAGALSHNARPQLKRVFPDSFIDVKADYIKGYHMNFLVKCFCRLLKKSLKTEYNESYKVIVTVKSDEYWATVIMESKTAESVIFEANKHILTSLDGIDVVVNEVF